MTAFQIVFAIFCLFVGCNAFAVKDSQTTCKWYSFAGVEFLDDTIEREMLKHEKLLDKTYEKRRPLYEHAKRRPLYEFEKHSDNGWPLENDGGAARDDTFMASFESKLIELCRVKCCGTACSLVC